METMKNWHHYYKRSWELRAFSEALNSTVYVFGSSLEGPERCMNYERYNKHREQYENHILWHDFVLEYSFSM